MGDADLVADARERWRATFPGTGGDEVLRGLMEAYTAPSRHYHDLRHVRDCLAQMERCRGELADPRAVGAAIWFHDAVYDPTRPDNEARSADLAERQLRAMRCADAFVGAVHDLILDTRHTAAPTTRDGAFLVDIDLSILGAEPDRFDAYDRDIRCEYAHVPDDAYRQGRSGVLRAFLARQFIYHTLMFRELYELSARANLSRALEKLHLRCDR